jgi:hypothetical protein
MLPNRPSGWQRSFWMTRDSIRQLIDAVRPRYRKAKRPEKARILTELAATTGYHRKSLIRLLAHPVHCPPHKRPGRSTKYGPKFSRLLIHVWELSGRLCSDRFHAFLPIWLQALEHNGKMTFEPRLKALLLSVSRATIDRKLREARRRFPRKGISTTKPGSLLKHQIPIRTFADWNDRRPGFTEMDLVAHCGDSTHGEFTYTLNLTDIASTWTDFQAVPNRGQRAVFAGLQAIRSRLPFLLLGIDSDNDSSFINDQLLRYAHSEHITFTRCRPYKKNDQAHIEQKNWSVVRRMVGYDRYEGEVATRALNDVFEILRLWINFFQPSQKLDTKQRCGSRVRRIYLPAKTPFQRLLESPDVAEDAKCNLSKIYDTLNPIALKQELDRRLELLWKLAVR